MSMRMVRSPDREEMLLSARAPRRRGRTSACGRGSGRGSGPRERHRRRRLAGQHPLEMLPRQPVLALEEERAGELQARANKAGVPDKHGSQGFDGRVQQRVLRVRRHIRQLRCLNPREADQKERLRWNRATLGHGLENGQRLDVAAFHHQRPRFADPVFDPLAGACRRRRLRPGARRRHGEQKAGGDRENAKGQEALHRRPNGEIQGKRAAHCLCAALAAIREPRG